MRTAVVRASAPLLAGLSLLAASAFFAAAYAADVTLLYSGETHAMLYPCNCPIEADGGIARRATLVKQVRKAAPNVVLVDSGAFFAGGLLDEYTQSTELDTARTGIVLRAMERMKYDAVAIGGDEFNFGRKFLEEAAAGRAVPFVSANIDCPNVSPFVVKSLSGVKVGIIGAAPESISPKAGGIPIKEPKEAMARAITGAKAQGADIIVVLSRLGDSEDQALCKAIDGIDVIISGNGLSKRDPSFMQGTTLFLRPSWQGRRLGKAVLKIKDRRISDYTVEEIRLSDALADDPEMLALEPQCFMDSNCRKGARRGTCQNPGAKNATCVFAKDVAVPMSIVAPKNCPTCQIDAAIDAFKSKIPGLEITRVFYPGPQADRIIKDFKLTTLPAYVFGKSIEQWQDFANMKDRLDLVGDRYLLKSQFGGIAVFLDRPFKADKLDVVLSLYDPNITALLDALEEFNPQIHFLAAHRDGQVVTAKGIGELEEMKRCVCIKKYYPGYFWNYLNCRVRNIESTWWQDCLGDFDGAKIKTCAQGAEGTDLLNENIALVEELQIAVSPTYLANNQNIFSSKTAPSKEEFRRILKSK